MKYNRQKDLAPIFEYFGLLESYIQGGFLEVSPATHEAYVTLPALLTLACTGQMDAPYMVVRKVFDVARHLRTYAEYLNSAKEAYMRYAQAADLATDTLTTEDAVEQAYENMQKPQAVHRGRDSFALHVVGDKYPHALKYTVLVMRRRRWFCPWRITDCFDIIRYD